MARHPINAIAAAVSAARIGMPQLGLNHASTAIATKGMNQLAISPTAFHPPGSMIVSPTANRPKNEESHNRHSLALQVPRWL